MFMACKIMFDLLHFFILFKRSGVYLLDSEWAVDGAQVNRKCAQNLAPKITHVYESVCA